MGKIDLIARANFVFLTLGSHFLLTPGYLAVHGGYVMDLFKTQLALTSLTSGGLMKHLAKDKGGKVVEDAEDKCDELMTTFNQHLRNKYDRYYYCFVCCEALNLFVVLCQLVLTNNFLGRCFILNLTLTSLRRRILYDIRV